MRFCVRSGCGREAVASCGFDYKGRFVWIQDVPRERDPALYDLCAEHASVLSAPRGWRLEDLRAPAKPARAPRAKVTSQVGVRT